MSDDTVALLCAECGWLLSGMGRDQAAEVPWCLACGHRGLMVQSVAPDRRQARWPKPDDWPGWAVYSQPKLDRALLFAESNN